MKYSLSVAALIIGMFLSTTTHAQDMMASHRGVGIRANIQTSHLAIEAPIWLSSQFTIAPFAGVAFSQSKSLDIVAGFTPRFYFRDPREFSPYVGLSAGVALYKDYAVVAGPLGTTTESDMLADFIGGISVGGEYFFNDYLSIGAEGQVNGTLSNSSSLRFGNPGGFNINTATAVNVTIYFSR